MNLSAPETVVKVPSPPDTGLLKFWTAVFILAFTGVCWLLTPMLYTGYQVVTISWNAPPKYRSVLTLAEGTNKPSITQLAADFADCLVLRIVLASLLVIAAGLAAWLAPLRVKWGVLLAVVFIDLIILVFQVMGIWSLLPVL